jgi:hypothetical protein
MKTWLMSLLIERNLLKKAELRLFTCHNYYLLWAAGVLVVLAVLVKYFLNIIE